jgi:hypothetical protein
MIPEGKGNTDTQLRMTTDHDEIRQWVESRGGRPAVFDGEIIDDETGVLRIDFQEHTARQTLVPISWDEFFQKFDQNNLAFIYQEETTGDVPSRYFRFDHRGTRDIAGHI